MKNRSRHFLAFCAAASVVVAAGSVIAAGVEVPVVSSSNQPGTSQLVELPAAPVLVQLPAPPARPAVPVEVEALRPVVADTPAVAEIPVVSKQVAKRAHVAVRQHVSKVAAPRQAVPRPVARAAVPLTRPAQPRPAIVLADASYAPLPPAVALRSIWMTMGTGF